MPDGRAGSPDGCDSFGAMAQVRIAGLMGFPALVRELGADPEPMIRSLGIDPKRLENPGHDDTMSLRDITALLETAERTTGCHYIGALLGSRQDVSILGVIGFAMTQAPTVLEALNELVRNVHLHLQDAETITLETAGNVASLVFVPNRTVNNSRGMLLVMEDSLAVTRRLLQIVHGPGLTVMEVQIAHAPLGDTAIYSRLFRAPVRFDQERYAIVFPIEELAHPVPGSNPELSAVLHSFLEILEERYPRDKVAQIECLVQNTLDTGHCSAETVARMLNMHRRTLHRVLKSRHRTFRELVQQCRRERARQLLGHSHLPITRIADALGYSEVSTFNHAFKRWYGITPTAWRRETKTVSK
jgi:AraC-like DNA-binding protein